MKEIDELLDEMGVSCTEYREARGYVIKKMVKFATGPAKASFLEYLCHS